jgi:hypothetical protein
MERTVGQAGAVPPSDPFPAGSSRDAATDSMARHRAGDAGKGEFRCDDCHYGVVISQKLPNCPMCGGEVWEASAWHPFSRNDEFVALRLG